MAREGGKGGWQGREEAREARVVVGEGRVRSGWCGGFGGGTGTDGPCHVLDAQANV